MSQISNFEEYGRDYQLQLFNEIITDHKFGLALIDILNPEYFSADVFNKLAKLIQKYYKKHEVLLNFPGLRTEINLNFISSDDTVKQQLLDTVALIEKCPINNLNVQDKALRFCKFKKLQTTVNTIKIKVDKNQIEEYESIEKELKEAFTYRDIEDPVGVMDNIDQVLDDESREPIPTGIDGIDTVLHGGLAKGEVGLVIAPLGVGKTTFLTKVANKAYTTGRNVLQIYFEDKTPAIQRKHFTAMSDVPLNELSDRKEEVKKKLEQVKSVISEHGNCLHLKKLPADGVTITTLKNVIKQINSKFPKVEVIVLDYIDCLSADKVLPGQEDWSNEGKIMRQFEVMVEELNLAGWTATQGGRSSTSLEVVKVDNMGGNLKKAQIAHFIMSIGKTLEQKEAKIATISILKNRMGDDGMIFANCKFDNSRMLIDTNEVLTEKGFEEQKVKANSDAAQAAIKAYNASLRANNTA